MNTWGRDAKTLLKQAEKCNTFEGVSAAAVTSIAASLIAITELLEAREG